MPRTEVAYVCSPDRFLQLAASVNSLFSSGSHFDAVRIYCVGRHQPGQFVFADERVVFADERVSLARVASKCPDYFLLNKTYAAQTTADRLIFVDTDTLVLRPLDPIWRACPADTTARRASGGLNYNTGQADAWARLCRDRFGKPAPYFNAGFVIFQHRAQLTLRDAWEPIARDGLAGRAWDARRLHGRRFTEQLTLSLAIRRVGLSWRAMSPREQAFGWKNELTDRTHVLHTGNRRYHRLLAKTVRDKRVSARVGLPFAQSVDLDIKQPAWRRLWTTTGGQAIG